MSVTLRGPLSQRPGRRRRLKGRALSPRRVRASIHIDQVWVDRCGLGWTVFQIHRRDRLAAIVGPREQRRYVTFADLGKDYRPEANDG